MTLADNFERKFVGRETELNFFREMLKTPKGNKRILLILGDGGIGKTYLVKELLKEAEIQGYLAPDLPIDLFSTDYRHIDGIQWKIKETIESLTGLSGESSPFADWVREKSDTSEQFYECLQLFCTNHQLVLAFDTFENLDNVASDWLFKGEKDGLQTPGLICIIAGRPKDDIDAYRNHPLTRECQISGFSLEETKEFYKEIEEEFQDPLSDDLLKSIGMETTNSLHSGLEWICDLTAGHPLKLEMAFRWLGNILYENSMVGLKNHEYEKKLMQYVREWGEKGELYVGSLPVRQPVFDTLTCMAYITRRFDINFLQFLVDRKLVYFPDGKTIKEEVTKEEVLNYLQRYFFVKTRGKSDGGLEIVQLHDEMARLVREHIWPYIDPSREKQEKLYRTVIQFYDDLISQAKETSEELVETLRIEKLYYQLQLDGSGEGLSHWFELTELGNQNISKLLPGEIKHYIKDFNPEAQVSIYNRIAEIERNAGHIKQALGNWENVKKLGQENHRKDWVVDAFIGMFNCKWMTEPKQALDSYLQPAQEICETRFREKLALIYYEKGFAYRQMQDFKQAIEWYKEGMQKFRESPIDTALEGILPNDMGYAYLNLGRWGLAAKYLKDALDIREQNLFLAEKQLKTARPENLAKYIAKRNQSALFVGLSRNTLGEYHRYVDELDESVKDYEEAFEKFRGINDYYWQAKCLCARSETYRRLAWKAWEQDYGETVINIYVELALKDVKDSLYLCEKYQLDDERDTAYRRLGRLSHDLALIAFETGNMEHARQRLEESHEYFHQGLEFARKTKETLEELENLTELAFLEDDALIVFGKESIPDHFKGAVKDLEKALINHRYDTHRIYQYPVFEALLQMEQAALSYTQQDYQDALRKYVDAYKGLGMFPGYGHARYKQHLGHLKKQIEDLPKNEQERWCKKFIEVWKKTRIQGDDGKTLAEDLFPDLVKWCNRLLLDLEQE